MDLIRASSTSDLPEYRIRVSVRNNLLLSAIEAAGYKNQSEFARAIGLSPQHLSDITGLRKPPILQSGEFSEVARTIMEALGACPTDLWTEAQLSMRLDHNTGQISVGEARMKAIMSDALLQQRLPAIEDRTPEDAAMAGEFRAVAAELLGSLTKREAQVLRMRYGFDGYDEHTLLEVGNVLDISAPRVRQIEAIALRKMRHPSRNFKIGRWLDMEDYQQRLDEDDRRRYWVRLLVEARKLKKIDRRNWKARWRKIAERGIP
jgi:RNA polymerase sigma factor (sigma-70 family)